MTPDEIIADLLALLPELEEGRTTHKLWTECDQKYRDENPDIGDKHFHSNMVAVYGKRISTINNAIIFIEGNTP